MDRENPYASTCVVVEGRNVSFRRIFQAWLSFYVITVLATVVLTLVVGAVLVISLLTIGADRSTAEWVRPIYVQSCIWLAPIPLSFLSYWWTVRRLVLKTLQPPPA